MHTHLAVDARTTRRMATTARSRHDRAPVDNGVRATFGPATPLDELMRLVAAEQDCCQFFDFAITVDTRGIALEVRSPADALPVLQSLFGAAA